MAEFKRFSIPALIFILALNGCGFKLKQDPDLSSTIKDISLVYKNLDPAFIHELKRSLEDSGVKVIDDSSNQLLIQKFAQNTRTIASNTITAKPTETQINYELNFSFTHDKQLLISPTLLRRSKEFTNNNNDISGMLDEEHSLGQAAQRELIELLLRRLESINIIDTEHGN